MTSQKSCNDVIRFVNCFFFPLSGLFFLAVLVLSRLHLFITPALCGCAVLLLGQNFTALSFFVTFFSTLLFFLRTFGRRMINFGVRKRKCSIGRVGFYFCFGRGIRAICRSTWSSAVPQAKTCRIYCGNSLPGRHGDSKQRWAGKQWQAAQTVVPDQSVFSDTHSSPWERPCFKPNAVASHCDSLVQYF